MLVLFYTFLLFCSVSQSRTDTKSTGHIVLITSPLFGHMIPLLDLAKRLSSHYHVTYVVSVSKLDVLKRHGFLDKNEYENDDLTQSRLEIIGLNDGNDADYEVSYGSAISLSTSSSNDQTNQKQINANTFI